MLIRQTVLHPHSVYHNRSSEYVSYARYVYDQINQRKFRYEEFSDDNQPLSRIAVLELWNTKKAYVTNITAQSCKIFNLK